MRYAYMQESVGKIYRNGYYIGVFYNAGPDWQEELRFWARQILYLHLQTCHKKARPATFHQCLFRCDLLLEIRKLAGSHSIISINMILGENLQATGAITEPVDGKYTSVLSSLSRSLYLC